LAGSSTDPGAVVVAVSELGSSYDATNCTILYRERFSLRLMSLLNTSALQVGTCNTMDSTVSL